MLFDVDTFMDKENQVYYDKESQVIHHKKHKYHKKWQGKKYSTY